MGKTDKLSLELLLRIQQTLKSFACQTREFHKDLKGRTLTLSIGGGVDMGKIDRPHVLLSGLEVKKLSD